MKIRCHYIDTCCPDYLSDHHNRDRELLIYAPIGDRESVEYDLYQSAIANDKVPLEISEMAIQSAIRKMVDELTDFNLNPYSIADFDDSDIGVYAYLKW